MCLDYRSVSSRLRSLREPRSLGVLNAVEPGQVEHLLDPTAVPVALLPEFTDSSDAGPGAIGTIEFEVTDPLALFESGCILTLIMGQRDIIKRFMEK